VANGKGLGSTGRKRWPAGGADTTQPQGRAAAVRSKARPRPRREFRPAARYALDTVRKHYSTPGPAHRAGNKLQYAFSFRAQQRDGVLRQDVDVDSTDQSRCNYEIELDALL